MNFILRNISIDDIDLIEQIEKLSFSIPWSKESIRKEIEENELAIYLVLEVDGIVRGYAGMWRVIDEGHITNIAVHPDWRRKHIGSSLMVGLLSAAEDNGIKRLTLEVRESNIPAQRMYKRFGFKAEGMRKNYYEDTRENAIIMWADII